MPKSLKWGILIAACMLLLFVAGHIFQDNIGALLGKLYSSFTEKQENVSFSDSEGAQTPWDMDIHSTDVDEDK